MIGEPRLLIDGRLRHAASEATFDNVNPADGSVLGEVADAGLEDVEEAVSAARRAFDDGRWAHDPELRRRCLLQLQAAMTEQAERLRTLIVSESGSPIALTHGVQLATPTADIGYWAGVAADYPYETRMPDLDAFGTRNRRLLRREPAGVVAAITPWNFPLYLNISKLAPALAAGCSVILKPAPDTPWAATELGRIIAEHTDIPPGVVGVLPSSSHDIGEALVTHSDVDLVTFTGSTATGQRIMARGASTLKRLVLELGGKSAAVVLDDADLSRVVTTCARAVTVHSGQSCSLATRLIVPEPRLDEAVAIAIQAIAKVRPGDPFDPKVRQGPVINRAQQERILQRVSNARAGGAAVHGGGVPDGLEKGCYVEGTVVSGVTNDDAIAREEAFGPVLVVLPHRGDSDAVSVANDSEYGLGGAVFSGDEERGLAVARRIRTGTVTVNDGMWLGPDTPVGGYKRSGIGREHGVLGFETFLETKAIGVPLAAAGS